MNMRIDDKELTKLISGGEGSTLEFKRSLPSKVREIAQEICAFANTNGGRVVIGVDDLNQIVGANVDNAKRSAIENTIREISPFIYCESYAVEIGDKSVWVIDVPEGTDKPYTYSGQVYRRFGTDSVKLVNAEDIRMFYDECGHVNFDHRPNPDFNLEENLDEDVMAEFCYGANISRTIPNAQILRNLDIYNKDGHPYAGAILFFAKKPEKVYDHAVIHCVRFRGKDKEFIIDDKYFGGPLLNQYNEAVNWLKSRLQVEYIMKGMGPRIEKWELPLEALKEALMNAICHRDYVQDGATIMVELYEDRVTITNPGGLLPQVARDFGRLSLSRNKLIFGLFTRMQLVEKVGSGILRMEQEMKREGFNKPRFENTGFFKAIFLKKDVVEKTNVPENVTESNQKSIRKITEESSEKNKKGGEKDGEKGGEKGGENVKVEFGFKIQKFNPILGEMKKNPLVTLPQIAEKMGVGARYVEKLVSQLKAAGRLRRIGPDKGGHWEVVEG